MLLSPVYSLRRLAYQGFLAHTDDQTEPADWRMALQSPITAGGTGWLGWRQRLRPYLAGISLAIALASIACASIFIVLAEASMSPSAIAFNRLLIAGIVFGLWQQWPLQRQANPVTDPLVDAPTATNGWPIWGLFLLAGGSFAGSLGCSAWSLTQTTVANSTLLNNMMPLFTTFGAWVLLRQQFSHRFVVGLAVAIAGVMIIGLQDLHLAAEQLQGDAAALIAAILLAITLLCIERLRLGHSTATTMAGLSLIGAVFLLPFAWCEGSLFPHTPSSALAVVALALISQVLGHGLLTYSLRAFSSSLVSVLMLMIPVMSALLAAVLFGQHLGWINSIAFGIVLSGVYLAISGQAPAAETEPSPSPALDQPS
jgi:drug/metabolite transporter (DMT)-like permease